MLFYHLGVYIALPLPPHTFGKLPKFVCVAVLFSAPEHAILNPNPKPSRVWVGGFGLHHPQKMKDDSRMTPIGTMILHSRRACRCGACFFLRVGCVRGDKDECDAN